VCTSLGGASTILQSFENIFLRNLDQNMFKTALFLGKKLKKSPQRWGLCPQIPVGLWRLGSAPRPPCCYSHSLCMTFLSTDQIFDIVKITTYYLIYSLVTISGPLSQDCPPSLSSNLWLCHWYSDHWVWVSLSLGLHLCRVYTYRFDNQIPNGKPVK